MNYYKEVWTEELSVSLPRRTQLTQYRTSVQPSMVMHWKTVSMAKKKLSKLVIPPLGPSHLPRHSLLFIVHSRPCPEKAQGDGSSSASRSATSRRWITVMRETGSSNRFIAELNQLPKYAKISYNSPHYTFNPRPPQSRHMNKINLQFL